MLGEQKAKVKLLFGPTLPSSPILSFKLRLSLPIYSKAPGRSPYARIDFRDSSLAFTDSAMPIFLATQFGPRFAERRARIAWRTFTFLSAFAVVSFASFAAPASYENLLKKARNGDIRAQVQVGIALLKGDGTLSDPAAAAEWFRRAANAGDPQAQTGLGFLYMQGLGVQRDPSEALNWFLRGALAKYPEAEYDLGMLYVEGNAGAPDPVEGIRWLTKAAEAGLPQARLNLGILYSEGRLGFPRDLAEGRRWLLAAAQSGSFCAEFNLGVLYNTGLGVRRDPREAQKWFQRASSHASRDGGLPEVIRLCGAGAPAHVN